MIRTDKMRDGSLVGAILGGLAASACCIGPLVLGLLGLGGAGALASLTRFRPYVLGLTVALLGVGFWLTYRRRAIDGDACGCERPRSHRTGRALLWMTTAFVVVFAAAPNVIAWASARGHRAADSRNAARMGAATEAPAATLLRVEGMDCESCAVPIRNAIERVGGVRGVEIDIEHGIVTVLHDPRGGNAAGYVDAVNRLGYRATLQPERRP